MFRKISILVPTRGRVKRLETLMRSYNETSDGETSELVYRADDNDRETVEFLRDKLVVVGPRLHGYDSLPVFFNDMLHIATGDVFMMGNDDMVFRTPGWAQLVLSEANKYSDGLFDIGVNSHNRDHYPFATVSRRAVDILGFIWDPRLYWGDIFLRDVMGHFGRCVYLPNVRIDHDWAGWNPDRTFVEGNQLDAKRHGKYWSEVHTPAVLEAIQKLESLYEPAPVCTSVT